MYPTASTKTPNAEKLIWFFLAGWTILNAAQAYTLGVHSDEAYYWVYSRFLDWGYYDHPPMVAIFIRLGYSLLHNELGLRLLTIITSTLGLRVLWLITRQYNADAKLFILIAGGVFIFHIYGFITTPDAPLFFFTVLFYYLYQQYLKADKWQLALLISLTLACLLYSKYHAILLIAFTLIANIKLLRRKSFWLIPVLTALLYLPHIYWQISHGYPSVNYHLFERSSEVYDFSHTYLFIPGQLLMAGPLIGWLLFYLLFKIKIKDAFIRTLLVNVVATFLFFLISTVKGNVQPHWTLIAFVPLALLGLIYFSQQKPAKWIINLGVINLVLIVCFRVALIGGSATLRQRHPFKSLYGFDNWAQKIKQKAGDAYVIFPSGFQEPSKYNFYTNSLKGFGYDTRYYRRTQYDIWPLEDSLQRKRTLYVTQGRDTSLAMDSIETSKYKVYTAWVDDTRTYQKIDIKNNSYNIKASPGQQMVFHLTITNTYPYVVDFSNKGQLHELFFGACFLHGDALAYAERSKPDFFNIKLQPNQSTVYTFPVTAPKQKGHYDLIFSLRTTPFPGGRNSRIINFTVQ